MSVKRITKDEEAEVISMLEIDIHNLAEEWATHSNKYFKLGLKLAKAREIHFETKALQDLCFAKVADDCRTNPKAYGLEKVTEGAIQQAVIQDDGYQVAIEGTNAAKYNMDFYTFAVEAFEHRKKGLENIVTLRGQTYFADPVDKSGGQADKNFNRHAAMEKTKVKLKRRE